MTRKNLKLIIALAFVAWCLIIAGLAFSATIWNQSAGTFSWYKYGSTNKYLPSTDLDAPTTWVKQSGVYIQCKSEGGATKYWQQGYDCYGKQITVTQSCPVFICKDQFGVVFDMTKNTVLTCPMLKISNQDFLIYEGLQAGAVSCR